MMCKYRDRCLSSCARGTNLYRISFLSSPRYERTRTSGRTLYSCIISVAVYSWVLFNGANLISEGGKACDHITRLTSRLS